MSKQFEDFILNLSETNATLDYFTDFEKIKSNINKILIKLNQLNYLIGKENLKFAIEELFEENPKVFDVLGILIAVRKNDNAKTFNREGNIVYLDDIFKHLKKFMNLLKIQDLERFSETKILQIL